MDLLQLAPTHLLAILLSSASAFFLVSYLLHVGNGVSELLAGI